MAYEYNTVAEFLEANSDDKCINRTDVKPSVLSAQVWHMICSFPGCLGDNHEVARSRESVLSSVEYWIDEEREFSPRYIKGQLRRFGICHLRDGRVITLEQHAISVWTRGGAQCFYVGANSRESAIAHVQSFAKES